MDEHVPEVIDVHEMEPLNSEVFESRNSTDIEGMPLGKLHTDNSYMIGILMLLIVRPLFFVQWL